MIESSGTVYVGTLNGRHGFDTLLDELGPKVILRLGRDPHPVDHGVDKRSVMVDRICAVTKESWGEIREINWVGLDQYDDRIEELPILIGDNAITESAAIGVMLLLGNELEGFVLNTVLPIGSGGDYFVVLQGNNTRIQVEVSGIRSGTGSQARRRLGEKKGQVRKPGFASVTTFGYEIYPEAHSFLHYFET